MSYEVTTVGFEGPLDLLLHLILREQIDLYEISLAELVDAYLAEMERMLAEREAAAVAGGDEPHLDLETATEFLLIAATLVELKTRRLLPSVDDGDLDDELALWEERDLLLARLVECTTFKAAATAFRLLAEGAADSFPRRAGMEEQFIGLAPDLLADTSVDDLAAAAVRAFTPRPVIAVDTTHLAPIRISVAEAVEEVADELQRAARISFRALTRGLVDRMEVVVRFLAILELFKQGRADLLQITTFGDIELRWIDVPVDASDHDGAGVLVGVDSYDG